MRNILSLAVCILLCAPAADAQAQVYKWKDANGVVHYDDHPHDGAEQKALKDPTGGAKLPPPRRGTRADIAARAAQREQPAAAQARATPPAPPPPPVPNAQGPAWKVPKAD